LSHKLDLQNKAIDSLEEALKKFEEGDKGLSEGLQALGPVLAALLDRVDRGEEVQDSGEPWRVAGAGRRGTPAGSLYLPFTQRRLHIKMHYDTYFGGRSIYKWTLSISDMQTFVHCLSATKQSIRMLPLTAR
jgi:hypothetical protein